MHWQAQQFISSVILNIPSLYYIDSVLEVGSHIVNGSIRDVLNSRHYVGVDLSAGKGVDVICSGHEFKSADLFDLCISCECFEHNPFYLETFDNMVRHLNNHGLILFSCASTGRPEHGTSRTTPSLSPGTRSLNWDYYKNLVESDFIKSNELKNLDYYFFLTNKESKDLYFVGGKGDAAFELEIARKEIQRQNELFVKISTLSQQEKSSHYPEKIQLIPKTLMFLSNTNPEYFCDKKFQKSVEDCFRIYPNSSTVNYLMAKISQQNEHEAISFASRASKLEPQNARYLLTFVELLERQKKFKLATKFLMNDDSYLLKAPLCWKLSRLYFCQEMYNEALKVCNEGLNYFNSNLGLWHCKLESEVKLNLTTEALSTIDTITSNKSSPPWLLSFCKKLMDTVYDS
jgi:SAM-dependent methyltransferase